MKKELIILCAIVYFLISVNAQEFENRIDSIIEKTVQLSLFYNSVLVNIKGRINFEKIIGCQDTEKNILNTSTRIYRIGYTNKGFTVAIILKLEKHPRLTINLITADNYMTYMVIDWRN